MARPLVGRRRVVRQARRPVRARRPARRAGRCAPDRRRPREDQGDVSPVRAGLPRRGGAANGGVCPSDGKPFQTDYAVVLVEALRDAENAGNTLENALEKIADLEPEFVLHADTVLDCPAARPRAAGAGPRRPPLTPVPNRFARRGRSRRRRMARPDRRPGRHRSVACGRAATRCEARTYASTVRQHIEWLSEPASARTTPLTEEVRRGLQRDAAGQDQARRSALPLAAIVVIVALVVWAVG